MILALAAGIWLVALLLVTLRPGITRDARRETQLDLAAIGGIALATLGFFWRLILGEVWMPAGGGDLAGFLYPTYRFAQEWWRQGVIPLWNPYLFAGQPFVGDIQSSIFYPLNLLTFFITNPLTFRDLELLAVLHYVIAGVGMYAFLRWGQLRPAQEAKRTTDGQLARAACLAGALALEFSDLFVTHFGNLNLIASASWLPLCLLFFSRAIDQMPAGWGTKRADLRPGPSHFQPPVAGSWSPVVLGGIILAISFLAGHPQAFLFSLFALGLYALYRAIDCRRDAIRIFASLGVTLAVSLGLSALVLVPSVEMARVSVRTMFTYENAAQYSLPPAELVGLFVPGFFGRGPQAAWGPWDRVEVGYLGVFPLILAALAIFLRRDSKTWFFAFLALAGLVLALGGYAILHGWMYALIPVFGQLRVPARFIYLLDFGLATLAALGMDTLLHPLSPGQERSFRAITRAAPWVFLLIALASGAASLSILILGQGQDPALFQRIANAVNSIWFFILLLGFSAAVLMARGRRSDPSTRQAQSLPTLSLASAPSKPSRDTALNLRARMTISSPVWSTLALALIFFDLFSLGAYVDAGLGDPTAAYNRQDVVDFIKSQGGIFRIDSRNTGAEGTWMSDTAALYGLYDVNGDNPLELAESKRYWEALSGREDPAYQLLNLKYVIARRNTPLPENFKRAFDGSAGLSVYENRNVLPHAWIGYSAENNGGRLTIRPPDTGAVNEDVEITGYGPNEIDLKVTAKQSGYLFLSEVYYPGWRALVDGRETEILRANDLFRALALEPGKHQVRVFYDPLSFKVGAAISGLTLFGLIGAGIAAWRKRGEKA